MSRTLAEVIALLERLAPLHLAEAWDNVGLLVEPSAARERAISRAFLCIDLEQAVLDEALASDADLIVAYHPPLFRGLQRLRASSAEERVILRAVEAGLAIYSPHTALDAATHGVNDWLGEAFGPARSKPIVARPAAAAIEFKLVVFVPRSHLAELRHALANELGAGSIGNYSECSYELEGLGSFFGNEAASPAMGRPGRLEFVNEVRLEMRCNASALASLPRVLAAHHPYEEPAWDVYPLHIPEVLENVGVEGAGRILQLETPISIADAVARLKAHLGVSTLRVATCGLHAAGAPLSTVALSAGAGGSLFEKVPRADLFVTGEMRHHDVLGKLRSGSSVILSEHTHTERGFLPQFAETLARLADGELDVLVSTADRDPLCTR